MKNVKKLVILAAFNLGLANIAFGSGSPIMGMAAGQQAQNLVTQFTNQYQGRIMDPNIDMAPNINYVRDVLNLLYKNGFTGDISLQKTRSELATVIWNAMLPTVNNYARYQNQVSETDYKTRTWNLLDSILTELSNTTFKDINQKIQASKTYAARPLPAIPTASPRPLPQIPTTSSNLQPSTSVTYNMPSMVFTLDLILKGALGGAYATKAKEIASFDYSQASKIGYASLLPVLQQNIAKVNADKSSQGTKVANLKKVIDSLYDDLNRVYRSLKIEPIQQPARPQQTPVQQPPRQATAATNQKTNIIQKQKLVNEPFFGMPVAEIIKRLPAWVSKDTYDLNVDAFKPVLAQYKAQNKNAQDKDIIQYFSAQIPNEFPFKSDVISSIKTVLLTQKSSLSAGATKTTTATATSTAATNLPTSSGQSLTSSQLLAQLPVWVNKNNFAIKQAEFNKAVRAYIEKSGDYVSDEAIIKYFSDQIPAGMAKGVKDLFVNEIESALYEFYRQ